MIFNDSFLTFNAGIYNWSQSECIFSIQINDLDYAKLTFLLLLLHSVTRIHLTFWTHIHFTFLPISS